mgnify:CR=1 FL=1
MAEEIGRVLGNVTSAKFVSYYELRLGIVFLFQYPVVVVATRGSQTAAFDLPWYVEC